MPQLCAKESFLKEVNILSEREKKVSLDIEGDFHTVQEMKDDLKMPESPSCHIYN